MRLVKNSWRKLVAGRRLAIPRERCNTKTELITESRRKQMDFPSRTRRNEPLRSRKNSPRPVDVALEEGRAVCSINNFQTACEKAQADHSRRIANCQLPVEFCYYVLRARSHGRTPFANGDIMMAPIVRELFRTFSKRKSR